MKMDVDVITVNGEEYIKKSCAIAGPVINTDGLPFVICRTYSAGVFAGFLEKRNGQEVVLIDARRLWYWKGAASLSQLAVEGVSCPMECKFPISVPRVELLQAIEIIECTEKSKKSIDGVPVWKK